MSYNNDNQPTITFEASPKHNDDGVIVETDAAILYDCEGDEHWIPKSQIIDDDGDSLTIPEWLYNRIFNQ